VFGGGSSRRVDDSGLRNIDRRIHIVRAHSTLAGQKRGSEDQRSALRGGLSKKPRLIGRSRPGLSVRFMLTASQKGRCTARGACWTAYLRGRHGHNAYDAGIFAPASLPKARFAVSSQQTRNGRSKIRSTRSSMPSASRGVLLLQNATNPAGSQPPSTRQPEITLRRSLSQHHLGWITLSTPPKGPILAIQNSNGGRGWQQG